jgi:hypothetical protein
MADDPERLQRRAFLLKDQEKLETALQWLGSTVTYNDPSDEDVEMSNTQEGHIKPAEDD